MSFDLREQCNLILSGHYEPKPSEIFTKMAEWCEKNNILHDVYGKGKLIQSFEKKIAKLLGYESGLFVMTGTLTQVTVLDLICRKKANMLVGMHESSHIIRHECENYQLQQRFSVSKLGNRYQPWTLADLISNPDELAAVLYELPMREIGGQLLSWPKLQEIKSYCKQKSIHLHMDGARLWECAAFYNKQYHEITEGFDTTYVSLYKGLGGLGGAILLGEKNFIETASKWMKRQGGDIYHRTPYVVSSAMQFDQRLAQMPALFERTKQLYSIISKYSKFCLSPVQPQANMLHLILPVDYETAIQVRDELAIEQKVWLGNPRVTSNPHQSLIEWYVGDTLLNLDDSHLIGILDWLNHRFSDLS
ncbi:beta-eliminating lyase-related protein [Vibrio europaeus]|uniref:threonine aldolase family protein n=1 Tax=Vibrio oreintalis group TaxID=1891919 RepID=UPI00234033E2|nr:beta-eliminating lyase-related protein [Vibrio europaeus]MDC5851678.1 beta-eliminating lyase-related protein [Vibrio europaeus]